MRISRISTRSDRHSKAGDTVIHLAARAGDGFTWEELRDTNVIGTRNVLEAARLAGCKRVVFASSGATVAGWEREEPYRALVEGPLRRRACGLGADTP